MATGDQQDMVARLKAVLPSGWFGDTTPVLNAVLNGIGAALALVYGLITYAALQTRIATATDGFLDLISFDYFGLTLPRHPQETDAAFRMRIQAELFLERGTRRGLIRALQLLTGRTPKIFEPALPLDTGAYNTNTLGYGLAGGYGSLRLPYQTFVIAYRAGNSGIPNVAGYNSAGQAVFSSVFGQQPFGFIEFGSPGQVGTSTGSTGAYNTPSQMEWASLSQIVGAVTDADIFNTIDSVMPAGTTAWTQLSN